MIFRYIIFFILSTFIAVNVSAQPVAAFISNKSSGCSPLTNVQFTDMSTGSPTSWVWKKNGVQFSTLQHPSASFSSPGVYTINLTVSNTSGSSNISALITVYSNPSSNFTTTTAVAGCLPHSVTFKDLSSAPGATITSRLWSFGDGGQSGLTNPVHTYSLSGNFPVSMKITDSHGCEDTKQIPNYIQVYARPNVSFSSNSVRQNCAPPLSVSFTNSSSGTGTLTYLWKFGDGSTSNSATPSHTYTSMGKFDVKLIVTDNNGCKDSLTYPDYVSIQPIAADFELSEDSICIFDSVSFVNTTQGALSYNWNYGDNSGGSGFFVWHTYTDSGWFKVRLIASIPVAGCSDTAFENVYVQRVVASFTTDPSFICQLPKEVAYINNSVNWSSRRWYRAWQCPDYPNPGDCGKKSLEDTMVYGKEIPNVDRIYKDTLVVTSDLGCIDTMVKDSSVVVNRVRGGPILSKNKGCRPYNISFTGVAVPFNPAVSIPVPAITMSQFEWYIDDTLYSTLQNPPGLNVVDTGLWKGIYKVENSRGCRDSGEFTIRAGDSVKADFYMLKDTVCLTDFDTAISLSQDTNYISTYAWNAFPAFVGLSGRNAAFRSTQIGYVDVVHMVDHHGCGDTMKLFNAFYAQGPKVSFSSSLFDCTDSTRISFHSVMEDAYRWYWNFGDSLLPIDSVNVNPVVNYSSKGYYSVFLTAYSQDSNCVYEYHNTVVAGSINGLILSDTGLKSTDFNDYEQLDTIKGCSPLTVHFTYHSSAGGHISTWLMDGNVFSGITADSIFSYTFDSSAYYEVYLIIFDTVANCIDTSMCIVSANRPVADFIGMPGNGCTPLNVVLQQNVSSLNPIVKTDWLVGSIHQTTTNFTQTFTSPVTYNARLIVSDTFGCIDTIIKEDYVRSSSFVIDFYATNIRLICAGDSIKFIQALPVSNVSYLWIVENGDSATGPTPWLVFPDSGSFDIKLIARDSGGCVKEQIKTDYVKVQAYPNPDFTGVPTDSTCYPLPVQFYADNNILYYDDNEYYYTLGDFSAASNYKDPFYNYVRPGMYTVSLKVTTEYGCSETITKSNYIRIGGAYGELEFDPDTACRGDSILFSMVNSINVIDFGWDFGDGNGILNTNPVYHVFYDSVGKVFPTLYFTDSAGGCSKTFTDTIYIFETVADFSIADTIGCVPFDAEILNSSRQANKYFWDFGDGSTSQTKDPKKIYINPGQYLIKLEVRGNGGCRDSVFRYFEVFPIPIAFAEKDTLICEGDSVLLNSGGGEIYSWSPLSGLNNGNIFNPTAYPVITTNYKVLVTDTNGCEDTDSVLIRVQNPIHLDLKDMVLIIGDTVTLFSAYGGEGVKYKWSPSTGLSCDTCPRPLLTALITGQITVIVSDTNGCFETPTTFNLEVLEKYTLDVPEAFTPNNDGNNDVIYVRGWGIRDLIVFKIYNRWGELVFESSELSVGWDGNFKGRAQDMETYVYYVEAQTYSGEILKKKGNINLLR